MLSLCLCGAFAGAPAPPPACDYNTPGTYVAPPCTWPSIPPTTDHQSPFAPSSLLKGVTLLANATAIPGYGADTWYPAEDRDGNLYSGFDDGKVGNTSVGSACTRPASKCRDPDNPSFHTGSAVVHGDRWNDLTVTAVGGAIKEVGLPMQGRYTCANAVANGTWWVGTYVCVRSKFPVALTGYSELPHGGSGVGAPHQCSLGAAACYLLFMLTRPHLLIGIYI